MVPISVARRKPVCQRLLDRRWLKLTHVLIALARAATGRHELFANICANSQPPNREVANVAFGREQRLQSRKPRNS